MRAPVLDGALTDKRDFFLLMCLSKVGKQRIGQETCMFKKKWERSRADV